MAQLWRSKESHQRPQIHSPEQEVNKRQSGKPLWPRSSTRREKNWCWRAFAIERLKISKGEQRERGGSAACDAPAVGERRTKEPISCGRINSSELNWPSPRVRPHSYSILLFPLKMKKVIFRSAAVAPADYTLAPAGWNIELLIQQLI